MDIPVYVMAGFLDSGKTQFINGTLSDGFAAKAKTLLLRCEEGEEDYDPTLLRNVTVVDLEDEEELTMEFLQACEKKYRPRQVMVEYNGMWQLETLWNKALPPNWFIVQTFTFFDAGTFDLYARNMGQLAMEKVKQADVLVFNRCDDALAENLRSRNLRMTNRRAQIYLEYENGETEDYLTGDECPFDLSQEVIDIPDEDFGVWYVDVMDHPDRYDGRLVHTKLMMCHSKKYPGIHCPGRFAMVCCENDIQFLGLIAKGDGLDDLENRDWIEVTAKMAVEKHKAYKGKGPVMNILSLSPCEKPAQEVVTF